MMSGLRRGFLSPLPTNGEKIPQKGKGKAVSDFQEQTKVEPSWEDLYEGLDPMDIEELKSSLGKPSWFDSEDCRNSFEAFRESLDHSSDCQSYDFIQQQVVEINHRLSSENQWKKANLASSHNVKGSSFSSEVNTAFDHTYEQEAFFMNPDPCFKISYSHKDLLALQHHPGQALPPPVNLGCLGLSSTSPQREKPNFSHRRRRTRSKRQKLIYHREFILLDRNKARSLNSGQQLKIYHPYSYSVITLCLQPINPHSSPNPSSNPVSKTQSTPVEETSILICGAENKPLICAKSAIGNLQPQMEVDDVFLMKNSISVPFSQEEATCSSGIEDQDTCTSRMNVEDTCTNVVGHGQAHQVAGSGAYGLIGLGFSGSSLGLTPHWALNKARDKIGSNKGSRQDTKPCHRKRLCVTFYGLWVGRYPIKRRCVISAHYSFPPCRIPAAPPEGTLMWVI